MFEKEHKHVMEAIREFECEEFGRSNFRPTSYKDSWNREKPEYLECGAEFNRLNFQLVDYTDAKGEKCPMYLMTCDGFTGAKATTQELLEVAAVNFNVCSYEQRQQHRSY